MEKIIAIPTINQIKAAHEAIKPYIHHTPVLTCNTIDRMTGAKIFFKCENFQKIGAFKMRGASYATLTLSEDEKKKGIATHSSGNHAQAVALSAKNHGIKAYIVMPSNAPSVKKNATLGYGAEVIDCESNIQSRQDTLDKIVAQTGASFIHPFDDYNVITGQATAAKELIEEVEALDIVMAPIGGGGLMSGTCLSTHYLLPNAQIIGAEPLMVNDAYRSWKTGTLSKNELGAKSIADGLLTNLSDKTFEIIQKYIDNIFIVNEEEIKNAMLLVWERMKIVIEPSSAVPLAAILQQTELFEGKRVGVILTGGNVNN